MATLAYTVTSKNAAIYADFDQEEMFILLHPDSTHAEHIEVADMLSRIGLEILDESEYPVEMTSNGWTKIWCAERFELELT